MNIVIAPHMPILANGLKGDTQIENLDLWDLSRNNHVTFLVPDNWVEFLVESYNPESDYELLSKLIELPVKYLSTDKKAAYIKISPDILIGCEKDVKNTAKQQLFALWKHKNFRRIYAGTKCDVDKFNVTSDKVSIEILHYKPSNEKRLKTIINSFEPELDQLKHFHKAHKDGNKEVSPFSAYDRNDEQYARSLLKQAYDDFEGDITERTYLYTYDAKYKTFVEFRPDRGNKYHGMDIDINQARKKAPEIVRRYNQ